jgi:hypothetical protein
MDATEKTVRFIKDRSGREWTGCAFAQRIYGPCRAKVVGHWKHDRAEAVSPICRKHANELTQFAIILETSTTNYLVEVSK